MDGRTTAMLMLAGLLWAQASVFAAAPPQPITTNKTRFRIPFKIEPAALQRMNARELQLYVSRDSGVTWEMAQSLPPDGSKFEYQTSGDGEYWFAVKTLDGRNQLHPPVGRYETGLIVQVDTAAPLLDLNLQQLPNGKVQLSWNAADAHLDPATLKIEYLQPNSTEWETVEVTPKASGQIAWNVSHQGQVKVRGTISDTAANVGRAQGQVQIISVGDPAPKPRSGRRVPIAGIDDDQEQATNEMPAVDRGFGPPPVAAVAPSLDAPVKSRPPEESSEPAEYRGPIITPFGGNSSARTPEQFVSENSRTRPEITRDRWDDQATAETPKMFTEDRKFAESSKPSSEPARTSGARRVVGSRRFQVGYTIEDVGPSGIGSVDLFITQDNGRKWWKYGEDPDRRSPFDVEVPQDGEYGFQIRVRSGVGLTNDPPLPGEPPAIIVAVDQTPPSVELVSAQQGQGQGSNRVQVRWRVTDEHLASKPVAIFYAPTRSGPWEPVSGWTEDRGGFEWTVGPGSPSQFYVRVVARDTAGNTNKAESAQPIMVDLARPTARIVDVEAPQSATPR